MSGTTAKAKNRKAQERKKTRLANELSENREAIKAAVCKAFGWKSLEPFAEDMISRTLNNELVDMPKLLHDLRTWQEAQTQAGGVE